MPVQIISILIIVLIFVLVFSISFKYLIAGYRQYKLKRIIGLLVYRWKLRRKFGTPYEAYFILYEYYNEKPSGFIYDNFDRKMKYFSLTDYYLSKKDIQKEEQLIQNIYHRFPLCLKLFLEKKPFNPYDLIYLDSLITSNIKQYFSNLEESQIDRVLASGIKLADSNKAEVLKFKYFNLLRINNIIDIPHDSSNDFFSKCMTLIDLPLVNGVKYVYTNSFFTNKKTYTPSAIYKQSIKLFWIFFDLKLTQVAKHIKKELSEEVFSEDFKEKDFKESNR